MFDLPTETMENKRDYTRFRKGLLKDGFMMLQYSIYARYLPSEEAADSHRSTIRAIIPPSTKSGRTTIRCRRVWLRRLR